MKDHNYIHIGGWMVNWYKLSGNELILYALIYGFVQDDPNKWYEGSLNYMAGAINASKPTVIKVINKLIDKGLIEKNIEEKKGVKFNKFRPKFSGKDSLPPVNFRGKESKKFSGKEPLPNNTTNNNNSNNNSNNNTPKVPTNEDLPGKHKKEKTFEDFPEEVRMLMKRCFNLFDAVIRDRVKQSKKQMKDWLYVIDLLHRKDGYSYEEIEEVIKWGREDVFWRKNLLSIARLRDNDGGVLKFEKIRAGMASTKNTTNGQKSNKESSGSRVDEAEQNFVARLEEASRNAVQE